MSQIIATTLGNGSKSVPVDTVVEGSAKAWLNLNGTGTIVARDSFNTSSVVDTGVGDYQQNFATVFENNSYVPASMCDAGGGTGDKGPYIRGMTASAFSFATFTSAGAFVDNSIITVSIHK